MLCLVQIMLAVHSPRYECVDMERRMGFKMSFRGPMAVIVQALLCNKASDRVDTANRKMLVDDLASHEQCHAYLSSVAYGTQGRLWKRLPGSKNLR